MAARIRLAYYGADGPLSDPSDLAAVTGLDVAQIHQALGWQRGRANERMQRLFGEAGRARSRRRYRSPGPTPFLPAFRALGSDLSQRATPPMGLDKPARVMGRQRAG